MRKMSLSRRTMLRGMGATLALPLLDAMVPAFTATVKTAANPVRRFGAVFVPLGERPGFWTPAQTGANFEMSPILEPLEPYRDSMTVVSELCTPRDGHAVTVAAWLTGALAKQTIAEDVYANTSIDQVIAAKIAGETIFPSLELATEDFTGYIGGCDTQFACAYMNTITWKTPTTPLPMEINPRVVFERMFGQPGTSSQRLERLRRNRSILDSVTGDVSDLERGLGARDRSRLTEYLDHIREIEQRIQRAEKQATTDVVVPDAPIGVPDNFADHAALMYDLIVLAFQTDTTRVFTFMKSRDASQRVYPEIGITEPHHSMSHHGNDAQKIANLVKLNTWHVSLFAKFIDRMKNTPDGDGSLLDHSLILYGSGMSESNTHLRLDVPTLLMGGDGGRVKGNRHIRADKETPLANFMLGLGHRFGAEMDTFGLSTESLDI
ncbi:MAG TPA: DUF1552 domain-containing protein [Vicinamibacterales bacterium]|nr:DUF1552 domain-containing protein [Vicinamibacterales bacterium]